MRHLEKMLQICRRKSLGMEIKGILMQRDNGIIYALEASLVHQSSCANWALPLGPSAVVRSLTH